MSVTSSTDPVQTVLDILTNTTDSDYTGSKPTHIEQLQETPQATRENRTDEDALYVWSPADGEFSPFSADGVQDYLDVQVVQIEAWAAPGTSRGASELAADVRSHIAGTYWRDRKQKTAWNEIAPESEDDQRAHQRPRTGDHEVVALQVRLERRADT